MNRMGFNRFPTGWRMILALKPRPILFVIVLLGLVASCSQSSENLSQSDQQKVTSPVTSSESKNFDGTTINVLTLTKPLGATVEERATEFEGLTGANINVTSASYPELYETILSDLTTGSNQYDVVILTPNWMPDHIESGYLKDLTQYVNNDPDLEWEDIAPFFQEYGHVYDGKIYSVPIDGNYHIMYYRADLLSEAGFELPDTWDKYLEIAKYFNGKDLNDDGEADYGSCLAKKPGNVTYWAMWSIAASMLQSQGTQQGISLILTRWSQW